MPQHCAFRRARMQMLARRFVLLPGIDLVQVQRDLFCRITPDVMVSTNMYVLLCPADVLSAAGAAVEFVIPKEGNIPITDKYSLTAVLTPTPRWPDAMCIIDPATKVVFTSKFFSAHVAPGLLNSKVSRGTHLQDASQPAFLPVQCHSAPIPGTTF